MGQFSWIYSDTNKQLKQFSEAYLLVPIPFQDKYGKFIYENCYDGYGNFGKYDVYDLIPEWNKEMIPEIVRKIENNTWCCNSNKKDIENLQNFYEGNPINCELRWLGIIMSCYDEDNLSLEYPIKITSKKMSYDEVSASLSDPNQGGF